MIPADDGAPRRVRAERRAVAGLQSRDLAGGRRGPGMSAWDAPIKVVGVLEVPNHSAPVSPTGAFSWEWILSFHVQGGGLSNGAVRRSADCASMASVPRSKLRAVLRGGLFFFTTARTAVDHISPCA